MHPGTAKGVMVLAKFMSCYTANTSRWLNFAWPISETALYGLMLRKETTTKMNIVGFADADLGNDRDVC